MMDRKQVILIDDEEDVRLSVSQTLTIEGFDVTAFSSATDALAVIASDFPGVVISDLKMPLIDGMGVLGKIKEIDRDLPVILITGHGDIPIAVKAIHEGAYDFIEKTSDPESLIGVVHRAISFRNLVLENRVLRMELDAHGEMEYRLLGKSVAMENLRGLIGSLSDANVDVLLVGETGTGKEVVARCLHDFSHRAEKPFVALNCGALAESVIESELFGHEEGAFTGAAKQRTGKIEYAEGGTLFLDEIESMPMAMQVKMLRVLQERSLERVGGNKSIPVDIRVIAASKVDLAELSKQEKFREDLFYRLQVAQVNIPALRDRGEDIPMLFSHFVNEAASRFHRAVPEIDEVKIQELALHTWPGNVRELRNAAERFVLQLGDLGEPQCNAENGTQDGTLRERIACFERATITEGLSKCQGKVGETAKMLGLPRKALYLRMQKYGIDRDKFK